MKYKREFFFIGILVLIDQFSKLLVYNYLLNDNISIIPSLLEIKPVFNTTGPFLLSKMNVKLNNTVYIIVCAVLIYVFFVYYTKRYKKKNSNKMIFLFFVLVEAGVICAFLSDTLWMDGCLDFIYLKPFFTFDFKDFYMTCGGILLLLFYNKFKE